MARRAVPWQTMAPGGGERTTAIMSVPERARDTANPPFAPSARLVCVVGHAVGRSFPITGTAPVTIGRADDADIVIEGAEVSRHHARIRWERGQFVLTDLGSRNGTLVNGVSIREHVLASGDRVQIGGWTVLVFAIDDDLEQRALRLQRLESLAALTGGIVHDFKNTLGAILTNAELLRVQLAARPGSEAETEMVDDIVIAARASLDTARRLLYFSDRDEGSDLIALDLGKLVDGVMAVAGRALQARRINVEIAIGPRLVIRGRPDELHHVLLNLIMNARDAMREGGVVRVAATARTLARTEALELHLPVEGDYLELTVSDTGCGMDAATQARALEPFFTTKPAQEGTGLGLSTVYGVVRRLGGNVLIESAVGRGTTMRLLLPRG